MAEPISLIFGPYKVLAKVLQMQNISQNTFEAARNMKHIRIEKQPITGQNNQ